MNSKEYNKHVKEVNKQREAYIESPEYFKDMLNITLQNLNFKSNDILEGHGANALTEFMSLYTQLIDLYPKEFGPHSEELKQSIINSIYSYSNKQLFEHHLEKLENDNPNSFLIIPTVIYGLNNNQKASGHLITTTIKKVSNLLVVTTFDKAELATEHIGQYIHDRKPKMTDYDYVTADYSYYLDENKSNIKLIVDSVAYERKTYFLKETERTNSCNINLKRIEQVALAQGFGTVKAKEQVYGNCFIKELMSGLKYNTLPHVTIQNTPFTKVESAELSTQKCNTAISYLMMCHLKKMGYPLVATDYIRQYIMDYNSMKKMNTKDNQTNDETIYGNIAVYIQQEKDQVNVLLDGVFNKKQKFPQVYRENTIDYKIHYGNTIKLTIWSRIKRLFIRNNTSKIDIAEKKSESYQNKVKQNVEALINHKKAFKSVIATARRTKNLMTMMSKEKSTVINHTR